MSSIEIYRSHRLNDCEQRAFVLQAVGIASEIVTDSELYAVVVAPESAENALRHLQRYDTENAVVEPPLPRLKAHPHAWITPLVFVVTMLSVGYFAGENTFAADWYDVGALRSAIARSGEWQRSITALTLHADVAHLLGNLGFGAFFSYLAARLVGGGVAWGSIVVAAALGNLLDSIVMPAANISLGASTAVFATLGLVAAYSWRQEMTRRMRWVHRWAPLIAGIALLALIGTGGERTDVVAHLTGFFCGAILGAAFARGHAAIFNNAAIQWTAGLTGTAMIVGAWAVALLSHA